MTLAKQFKSLCITLVFVSITFSCGAAENNTIFNTVMSRMQRYGKCIRGIATPEEQAQAKKTIVKDSAIIGAAAFGVFVMSSGSLWVIKKCINAKTSDLKKSTDKIKNNDTSTSEHQLPVNSEADKIKTKDQNQKNDVTDSLLAFDQFQVADFNQHITGIETWINDWKPTYQKLLNLPDDERSKYTNLLTSFNALTNLLTQLKEANSEYINATPQHTMISKEQYAKFQATEEQVNNIVGQAIQQIEEAKALENIELLGKE